MGKDFAARHAVYIGAAIVLKLICGADDCVWLSPFLARAKGAAAKAKVGCKYVCTVVLITCVAAGLALAIRRIAAPAERKADEGIGTAAGVLLMLYALYTAREDGWFPCCPPDEDDDDEEESMVADALTKLGACCDCIEDEEEPLRKAGELPEKWKARTRAAGQWVPRMTFRRLAFEKMAMREVKAKTAAAAPQEAEE